MRSSSPGKKADRLDALDRTIETTATHTDPATNDVEERTTEFTFRGLTGQVVSEDVSGTDAGGASIDLAREFTLDVTGRRLAMNRTTSGGTGT